MLLLKSILADSWFRAAAAVALLQQCLVAGGTYLMGDITARLPSEGISWERCGLLLACLALSGSVVFYFMNLFSLRAQHGALRNFLGQYFSNTFNKPLFWRQADERARRHDMMCREAQDSIQEGNAFLLDVWTTAWNILLNTVSIVLVIGPQSGAVIVAAGTLSSLLVHFASARISRHAIDEMDSQNQLNSHLSASWDNLVLGNSLSFSLWKNRFENLFQTSTHAAERSLSARERVLAAGNFFTSTAIAGTVLVQAWLNQNNTAAVLALFAMLPRTLQINMHVHVIHSYWAGWQRLRERLTLASDCLSPFPESKPHELINAPALQIVGQTNTSSIEKSGEKKHATETFKVDELIERLPTLRSGRLTIRGMNGAGKSVFLSLLKEKLSNKAFYLPAQHNLALPGVNLSQSHGEKTIAALDAVEAGADVDVLLLDEWDANLSPENRSLLSQRIETLSARTLVIEVRHNQDALSPVVAFHA